MRISSIVAAILLAATAPAGLLSAQSPWTIKITPTLSPLPGGLCGAVHLTVTEAGGKDVPRNPAGYLVTLADFDMTVNSETDNAVVGQRIDASHWSVCTCQGAPDGTMATVTAKYPAESLAARSRVPDLTLEETATFSTAAAKGTTNPKGCRTPAVTASAEARPASGPVTTGRPVGTVPDKEAAVPKELASPRMAMGFRLLPSVPIVASLGWDSVPGAVKYVLFRSSGSGSPVERASTNQGSERIVRDIIDDPRITYRYTLFAHFADGKTAEAPAVEFISPPLKNPSGFTATDHGLGRVDFAWQPVPGAIRYRLDGPGIAGTGYTVTTTDTWYPKIPAGAHSWKLTALYQKNFADYEHPSTASAVVRVLPAHSQPWLTKNNGPNSAAVFQAPSPSCYPSGQLDTAFSAASLKFLGRPRCVEDTNGLQSFSGLNGLMPLWGDTLHYGYEAVYGNAIDLGVGRRTDCAQIPASRPGRGVTTVCYATAHGVVPGQAGFNDLNTITHPQPGLGDDFILSMVITKDDSGSVFLVLLRGDDSLMYGRATQQVSLDTEGPKYVPQVCMSCHGGKYNTKTRKVDGASFLPLDPELLAFASPADLASAQENIRTVNTIIQSSAPSSAVAAYIRGLYGNAWTVPGTVAIADYVPSTWQDQAGLYRQVVRPYCATCHLAAPAELNFTSWGNFRDNGERIRAAVCGAHTMPHAELQFKSFWLKDTGPVHLPGLLAASLGFPSCS